MQPGGSGRLSWVGVVETLHDISHNVSYLLAAHLRYRGCGVFSSDQQVRLSGGDYESPDVVTSCQAQFDGSHLLTPELFVKVLSTSTAEDNTGRKLRDYTRNESLLQYWVVEQRELGVTRYYRTDEGQGMQGCADPDDVLASKPVAVEIPLRELYRHVF